VRANLVERAQQGAKAWHAHLMAQASRPRRKVLHQNQFSKRSCAKCIWHSPFLGGANACSLGNSVRPSRDHHLAPETNFLVENRTVHGMALLVVALTAPITMVQAHFGEAP
jgi:hypothetical protein